VFVPKLVGKNARERVEAIDPHWFSRKFDTVGGPLPNDPKEALAGIVGVVSFIANFRRAFEKSEDKSSVPAPVIKQSVETSPGSTVQQVGQVTCGKVIGVEATSTTRVKGSVVGGNVRTDGGDFIGHDQIVQVLPPAAGVHALHQLPAPPIDFTGRTRKIKELDNALAEGKGNMLTGLRGLGGVGKTALALMWAERIKDLYPDAQLFITLGGSTAQPMRPEDVLARAIRAFEPEAKLPEGLEELGSKYRTLLSGKKVLVFLDDARDDAQVRPLIPPPGSLVLVTSRRRFTLPGMHTCELEALPMKEAVTLLRAIAGKRRLVGRGKLLAKLCGYLPLALRAAASLLQQRPSLSAEKLC